MLHHRALRLVIASIALVTTGALGLGSARAATSADPAAPIPTHVVVILDSDSFVFGEHPKMTISVLPDDGQTAPVTGQLVLGFPSFGGIIYQAFRSPATVSMPTVPAGISTFTAYYQGLGSGYADSSVTHTVTVARADTTSTVTLSSSTVVYGKPLTGKVTVASATGTTVFGGSLALTYDAQTVYLQLTSNPMPFTLPPLAVGTHRVSAQYRPEPNFNASSAAAKTWTVTKAPTTTTASISGLLLHQTPVAVIKVGAPTPASGSVRVAWLRSGTTLHTRTVSIANGQVTAPLWETGRRGSATVLVTYLGNANLAASSRSVTVTVR